MGFVSGYVKCLGKVWPIILVIWLAVLIFGIINGPNLLLHTDNTVPVTPNTPSAEANAALNEGFEISKYTPWLMMIECPEGAPADPSKGCGGDNESRVINKNTENLITAFTQLLKDKHSQTFDFDKTLDYYIVPEKLKSNFLSSNGLVTIVQWSALRDVTQSIRFTAYETLRDHTAQLKALHCPNCAFISHTGGDPLTYDVSHSLAEMLLKSETVIIPISALVFLYMISWNWRLALITLLQLGASILGTFAFSDLIADYTSRPQSITPQMIEVITMAILIDYSLFMFTRFVEELRVKKRRFSIRRAHYTSTATSDLKSNQDKYLGPNTLPIIGQDFFGLVYDPGLDSPEDPHPAQTTGVAKRLLDSALVATMAHSGHVVLSSGATLLISFAGFFISQCSFLIQPAMFTALGVLMAIFTSLTLPFALIQAFPSFFTDFNLLPAFCYACCKTRRKPMLFDKDFTGDEIFIEDQDADSIAVTMARQYGSTAPNRIQTHESFALANNNDYPGAVNDRHTPGITDRTGLLGGGAYGYGTQLDQTAHQLVHRDHQYESASHVDLAKFHKSWSYRFGKYLVRFPFNIIVMLLVFGALGFFAYNLKDLSLSSAYQLGLPRNGPTVKTMHKLQEHFPPGIIQPFHFVIKWVPTEDYPSPGAMMQDTLYTVGHDVLTTLDTMTSGYMSPNYTQSPFYFDGKYVDTAEKAQEHFTDLSYLAVWLNTMSKTPQDTHAGEPVLSLITLMSPQSPDHPSNTQWIKDARKHIVHVLNEKYADKGVTVYLAGYKAQEQDTIDYTDDKFPMMLSITFVVVLVLVSFILKSAFVPIRLTLTLALPIAAVFGACVLVYQKDALAWMHFGPFRSHGDIHQIYWELIPFCSVVLLSLALDYDIFILTRIIEYRNNNYSSQASILLGLYSSSSVINAAGILMSLAFAPLFALQSQACAELGFLLCAGVLVDTFIIRPVLVPCVFSIGDRLAWWPRKVSYTNLKNYDGTIVQ